MGSVLPRENSGVDAVPCRILTQSTGFRRAWVFARLLSFAGSVRGANSTFLGKYGADRSQPGRFQECAPAWTIRLIVRHVTGSTFP